MATFSRVSKGPDGTVTESNSLPTGAQTVTPVDNDRSVRSSRSSVSQPVDVALKISELKEKFKDNPKELESQLSSLAKESSVKQVADKFDLTRRYLLAVCRVISGQFDGLSIEALVDIVGLCRVSVNDFESWLLVMNEIEKSKG